MTQPKFTWWPWRLLALLVPLIAVGAAWFAYSAKRNEKDVLTVFHVVLAAGNAYILSMAAGSLGRSLIAIAVGIGAGAVSVHLLSYPTAVGLVISFMVIAAVIIKMNAKLHERILTVLIGLALNAVFIIFPNDHGVSEMGAIAAYPFTSACIAACLAKRATITDVLSAALNGAAAALGGMGLIMAVLIPFIVFIAFMLAVIRSYEFLIALAALILSATNFSCIYFLFGSLQRAETAPPNPGAMHPAAPQDALDSPGDSP